MATYSLNLVTTVTTSAAAAWDMKAAAANLPKIMQLDVQLGQAAAGTYGIGRPANDSNVAQTGATAVLPDDPSQPVGQTTCAIQWTTAPTVPTLFVRRAYLPAVLDAAIIWTFPRGLGVLATRGMVLWNLAANPTPVGVNLVIDE